MSAQTPGPEESYGAQGQCWRNLGFAESYNASTIFKECENLLSIPSPFYNYCGYQNVGLITRMLLIEFIRSKSSLAWSTPDGRDLALDHHIFYSNIIEMARQCTFIIQIILDIVSFAWRTVLVGEFIMYALVRFLYLYFVDHILYIYTPAILVQSMDVPYKHLFLMMNNTDCCIVLCNRIYTCLLSFMYCL